MASKKAATTVIFELGISFKKFKSLQEQFLKDLAAVLGVKREDLEIVSVRSAKPRKKGPRKNQGERLLEALKKTPPEVLDAARNIRKQFDSAKPKDLVRGAR